MPSSSPKQHRFMAMVANDPAAAKRVGVAPGVGEDFVRADKASGKRFADKKTPSKEDEEAAAEIGRRLDAKPNARRK